jgi:hypothetical protein
MSRPMKKPSARLLDVNEVLAEAEWVCEPEPTEPILHTVPGPPCFFCGEPKTDTEIVAEHLGPLCGPCFRRFRAH